MGDRVSELLENGRRRRGIVLDDRSRDTRGTFERARENLPGSIWKRFGETGEFISGLAQTSGQGFASDVLGVGTPEQGFQSRPSLMGNIGRLGLGLAEEGLATQGLPIPQTPRREMLQEALADEARAFTAEGFAEDPTRALSTLASFVPGGQALGGSRTAQFVSRAGRALDPVTAATEAAGGVGRLLKASPGSSGATSLGSTVKDAASSALGLTSGRGGLRAADAVRAGVEGETAAVTAAKRGRLRTSELGERVASSMKDKQRRAGQEIDAFLDGTDAQGVMIDISDLKTGIGGNLEARGEGGLMHSLGVDVERRPLRGHILVDETPTSTRVSLEGSAAFTAADVGQFENAVRDLLESPNRITVRQLDEIKRGMSRIPTKNRDPSAVRVIESIRGTVRDKLAEVPGYNDAVKDFADFSTGAEELAERVGQPRLVDTGGKRVNRTGLGRSLANTFDEGVDIGDRHGALSVLDREFPDQQIRSSATGLGFGQAVPSGLVGKQQFFDIIRTGVAGGAVGGAGALGADLAGPLGAIAGSLGSLSVTIMAYSPRSASRILTTVGATERVATDLQKFAQQAIKRADDLGINSHNMTIGQLLERLDEQNEHEQEGTGGGFVRGLGRFR